MHDVKRKVCHIDVRPCDGNCVVVLVVAVVLVLAYPLGFGGLQGAVDADEVALNELTLVLGDLEFPDAAGEFVNDLLHEALAHVRLRRFNGGTGRCDCLICRLCHIVFLLSRCQSS